MEDVTIGAKLEADASGAINNVKNFKKELQLAQQEVVILSEKFGATSKEAAAAAKKAAELKDQIGDARQLVDAFNPDTKFRAFGASIQTVVGGFTALTGAMGLLGVESEEVQKTLLKVQSALALSQGIAQLQEGIQSIKNLGSVLVNTLGRSGLIGIAIAGVTALGVAIFGATRRNKELEAAQKEYNKAIIEARQEVAKVQNAFEQAKLGIISNDQALKQYNTTIGETVGQAKDLNEAEKLTAENADKYIKVQALKAKANFILSKSTELSANAEMARLLLGEQGFTKNVVNAFEEKIKESEKKAAQLETLLSGINKEIASLSIGFKTGEGKATTPAGRAKEQEVNEVSAFQKLLNQYAKEDADKEVQIHAVKEQAKTDIDTKRLGDYANLLKQKTTTEQQQADASAAIDQVAFEGKMKMAAATANALSGLSELFGRQTAAGKVFAVAEATINTYAAIAGSLRAFAGKPIPGYAIVQAIATGIFGLAQVKKILAVTVPGGKGAGSAPSIGSVSAPLQAALPSSTSTRLDRDQLNQIGNAAVRAFVVETDVTTNQERIRRLNRASRIS